MKDEEKDGTEGGRQLQSRSCDWVGLLLRQQGGSMGNMLMTAVIPLEK